MILPDQTEKKQPRPPGSRGSTGSNRHRRENFTTPAGNGENHPRAESGEEQKPQYATFRGFYESDGSIETLNMAVGGPARIPDAGASHQRWAAAGRPAARRGADAPPSAKRPDRIRITQRTPLLGSIRQSHLYGPSLRTAHWKRWGRETRRQALGAGCAQA